MSSIDPRDAADEQAAGALLAELPRAAADPAFRARLRDEFVRGAFGDEAVPARARPVDVRRPVFRRPTMRWVLAGAAAVLFVGVLAGVAMNPGPRWHVVPGDADGNLLVDGEAVPVGDVESLNDALIGGSELEWRGHGDLMLMTDGGLAMSILSGTRVTLPAPPPQLFMRHSEARIDEGEIRLTSGPRFHGAKLTVTTPEATVEITGTTLAVIREPVATCVCVLEGRVHVLAGEDDMGMVPAGRRATVFVEGKREIEAMRPVEHEALGQMKDAMGTMLRAK